MDVRIVETQLTVTLDDADEPHQQRAAARPDTALACLLAYAPHAHIALPVHAGVELVEQPQLVPVPGMPHFCRGLLAWQGRRLPLVDFQAYLERPDAAQPAPVPAHVLIVAYQVARGSPIEYGALCAPFLLRMIEVADSQQCLLPAADPRWTGIAISCLVHQGQAIPVLDPARIFHRPDSSGTHWTSV